MSVFGIQEEMVLQAMCDPDEFAKQGEAGWVALFSWTDKRGGRERDIERAIIIYSESEKQFAVLVHLGAE